MIAHLAFLWKTRWGRLLALGLLACSLLLIPFVRQSIFGPQIEGIPWCVWEDDIRAAARAGQRAWYATLFEKLGIDRVSRTEMDLWNQAALPVFLALAEDGDPMVRRFCVLRLRAWEVEQKPEVIAVYRRLMHDEETSVRIAAAQAVWQASKERAPIAAVLPLLDDPDLHTRRCATFFLSEAGSSDPNLFDALAAKCVDPDLPLRNAAVHSMRHFGKRAIPILRRAFADPDKMVRLSAIHETSRLGRDGAELYPDLQRLQATDSDPWLRRSAGLALFEMDPERFPILATFAD